MYTNRLSKWITVLLALMLLALALGGCGAKEEPPPNPFAGDWAHVSGKAEVEPVYMRILNDGKPLEGIAVRFKETGEVQMMLGDMLLTDFLKERAQEKYRVSALGLRELGEAVKPMSYRVEGDKLIWEVGIREEKEIDSYSYAFEDDKMTLTNLDTGEVNEYIRVTPPPAAEK